MGCSMDVLLTVAVVGADTDERELGVGGGDAGEGEGAGANLLFFLGVDHQGGLIGLEFVLWMEGEERK